MLAQDAYIQLRRIDFAQMDDSAKQDFQVCAMQAHITHYIPMTYFMFTITATV